MPVLVAPVSVPTAVSIVDARVVVSENCFGLKGPTILNLGSIEAINSPPMIILCKRYLTLKTALNQ